uniref:BZIP domain-containing protein n=1 Tax=Macrostomum lignano TaxID=282301 RepID=A0A1I8FBF1_9PLAT
RKEARRNSRRKREAARRRRRRRRRDSQNERANAKLRKTRARSASNRSEISELTSPEQTSSSLQLLWPRMVGMAPDRPLRSRMRAEGFKQNYVLNKPTHCYI